MIVLKSNSSSGLFFRSSQRFPKNCIHVRTCALSLLTFCFLLSSFDAEAASSARAPKAMVATAHPLATAAALNILKKGGNAADAAIAAQWVLNVVEPQSSGLGGGGFFLFYDAKTKRVFCLDGRETAPRDATPDMFLDPKNGQPFPFFPDRNTGGLPVGVPGTLRLLKTVHERFSSKHFSFESLFQPAIDIAEKGVLVSSRLSRMIDGQKERLRLFPETKRIFMNAAGQALEPGALLQQPDLAKTFRLLQEKGPTFFYEGALADAIVNTVRFAQFHPGRLTRQDLFYYTVKERDGVYGRYRGYDLLSMGLPSSGGVTLIETLNILSNFNLGGMSRKGYFAHVFSEAQKLAFQDRNVYLGDSDFSKSPLSYLLSNDLAREHYAKIQANSVLPVKSGVVTDPGAHTSHISIVDEAGNMVSFTTTIEHIFGSAMVVPGYGFFLNNELTDFDPGPFSPKEPLPPNAPEPEKRPRSSMTPLFVFKDGKPFLVAGSPGGSTIIVTMLNILVNLLDFHMTVENAVREPKIMNRDGATELETALFIKSNLRNSLTARGHRVIRNAFYGNAQVIQFDKKTGELVGVSDPRGEGKAEGY